VWRQCSVYCYTSDEVKVCENIVIRWTYTECSVRLQPTEVFVLWHDCHRVSSVCCPLSPVTFDVAVGSETSHLKVVDMWVFASRMWHYVHCTATQWHCLTFQCLFAVCSSCSCGKRRTADYFSTTVHSPIGFGNAVLFLVYKNSLPQTASWPQTGTRDAVRIIALTLQGQLYNCRLTTYRSILCCTLFGFLTTISYSFPTRATCSSHLTTSV